MWSICLVSGLRVLCVCRKVVRWAQRSLLAAVVSVKPCVAADSSGGGEGGLSRSSRCGGGLGERGGEGLVCEEARVGRNMELPPREKAV